MLCLLRDVHLEPDDVEAKHDVSEAKHDVVPRPHDVVEATDAESGGSATLTPAQLHVHREPITSFGVSVWVLIAGSGL